jgi:hypothetical protein
VQRSARIALCISLPPVFAGALFLVGYLLGNSEPITPLYYPYVGVSGAVAAAQLRGWRGAWALSFLACLLGATGGVFLAWYVATELFKGGVTQIYWGNVSVLAVFDALVITSYVTALTLLAVQRTRARAGASA